MCGPKMACTDNLQPGNLQNNNNKKSNLGIKVLLCLHNATYFFSFLDLINKIFGSNWNFKIVVNYLTYFHEKSQMLQKWSALWSFKIYHKQCSKLIFSSTSYFASVYEKVLAHKWASGEQVHFFASPASNFTSPRQLDYH